MHLLFQKCRIFFASKDENLTHISVLNDMQSYMLLQAYSKINPMVTSHDETTNKPTQSNLDREHATITKVIGKTSDGI